MAHEELEAFVKRLQLPRGSPNYMGPNEKLGAFIKVSLKYPHKLHDFFNDYPPCAESKFAPNMSEPMRVRCAKPFDGAPNGCSDATADVTKLILDLHPKVEYVMHYRNLQFVLAHGAKIEQVHSAVKFFQRPWLKSYIEGNTDERRKSQNNDRIKNLMKLLNNALYGKMIENQLNHRDIKLVTTMERAIELQSKENWHETKKYSSTMIGVEMNKRKVTDNTLMPVGIAILELSKLCMLEFHYDVMMKRYTPETCQLIYSDTDSVIYHITTPDLYCDILEKDMKPHFDLSKYPKDFLNSKGQQVWCPDNDLVLGKMKDEYALCKKTGLPCFVVEFRGIKPKSYAVQYYVGVSLKEKTVCKGNPRKSTMYFHEYDRCVHGDGTAPTRSFDTFAHPMHNMQTTHVSCRQCFDQTETKRYWYGEDCISSRAWGHWRDNPQLVDCCV
jgi:hypothetical protein